MWSGVKIVHGKPRHSQSQESVEPVNRDIEAQLVPCPKNILNYEKTIATAGVKEITNREAAGYGIAGSQSYTRCICKTKCKTNRCAYKKNNVLCNSKCHDTTDCENK